VNITILCNTALVPFVDSPRLTNVEVERLSPSFNRLAMLQGKPGPLASLHLSLFTGGLVCLPMAYYISFQYQFKEKVALLLSLPRFDSLNVLLFSFCRSLRTAHRKAKNKVQNGDSRSENGKGESFCSSLVVLIQWIG